MVRCYVSLASLATAGLVRVSEGSGGKSWSCYVLDSVRAGALLLGRQPMFPLAFSEGITYPSEFGNCPCGGLQFGLGASP